MALNCQQPRPPSKVTFWGARTMEHCPGARRDRQPVLPQLGLQEQRCVSEPTRRLSQPHDPEQNGLMTSSPSYLKAQTRGLEAAPWPEHMLRGPAQVGSPSTVRCPEHYGAASPPPNPRAVTIHGLVIAVQRQTMVSTPQMRVTFKSFPNRKGHYRHRGPAGTETFTWALAHDLLRKVPCPGGFLPFPGF